MSNGIPLKYNISFDPSDGTGTPATQAANFDRTVQLQGNTFTYDNHQFAGWKRTLSTGSATYGDGAYVKNLIQAAELQTA